MVETIEIQKGFKKTEVGVIPSDWEVKRLGNGINLLSGHHVLAQYCNTEGDGFPYLTGPADFPSGTIQHSKFTVNPTTMCRNDDILVTVKGSGAGTIVLADAEYCISRQLMAVRVTNWDNRYIYYSLLKDKSVFGAVATGLIPGLSRSDILDKLIPLPPTKAEQTAIATALNDADALITQLEKLIAKKRNIKQGAMQELLRSKEGWEVKMLGEIGECIIGLTYSPSNVKKEGKLVLRSSNIRGNKLVYENNVFVNVDVPERLITRKSDILICVRNGSRNLIGKCAYIDGRGVGETFGAFMSIFRSQFNDFLFHVLQSNFIQRQIEETIGATINQLTNKNLKAFEIPFPTPEEQAHIAQILSDMDAEIEALEKKLEKYKMIKQGMMQNLLTGKIRLV